MDTSGTNPQGCISLCRLAAFRQPSSTLERAPLESGASGSRDEERISSPSNNTYVHGVSCARSRNANEDCIRRGAILESRAGGLGASLKLLIKLIG